MERGAGERLQPGDLRIAKYSQESGRGDEHVERFFAVGGGELPLPVVISSTDDIAPEPNVGAYASFLGHLPEIRLYLWTRRQHVRPIGVWPKRVGVVPRRDIAGKPGIRVIAPGASDVVGFLENRERVDAGVLQLDRHAQARHARANYRDLQCTLRRHDNHLTSRWSAATPFGSA